MTLIRDIFNYVFFYLFFLMQFKFNIFYHIPKLAFLNNIFKKSVLMKFIKILLNII